ncbi:uncharacterized protein TNCV_4983061 [Trichonephila clavipes]|uniref:Uncharacterized protein n=1 Tax=Trichonephila clavipes TaxID=2585209 RepID=A0A8X6WFI9_TRICX|nr:uncharacterized protein TNCV_4983061 [Trichonephila clavipes]
MDRVLFPQAPISFLSPPWSSGQSFAPNALHRVRSPDSSILTLGSQKKQTLSPFAGSQPHIAPLDWGCGSPVVKVSNHGRHVMSSIPVPLKTRRVGQRCTLNLSRAETSSRWCGVVVRRGGASSGVVHVT